MNPLPLPHQSDNESLQADVMRFMAIIAFCLIAILALVKHAEPAEPRATAEIKPAAAPQPEPEVITAARPPTPTPSWQEPLVKPAPAQPLPKPTTKPAAQPKPVAAAEVAARPDRRSRAQAKKPAPAPAPAAEPEESLSLRFASDGDFLRLIARGDIRVYAFKGSEILSLDSGYSFLSARSPGQLYELLPQTIPGVIYSALAESRSRTDDSASYSWGVTLPETIQKQITSYVESVRHGQLVIDRYGDVSHVASN